ncbi:fluoride efflux transporter FluC [Streptomyces tendae]|uniref:fluoride efflux transporter FluC n=1 Tax=Streptomyces tendae TaxID=1932 RepID=UPI0037BBC374
MGHVPRQHGRRPAPGLPGPGGTEDALGRTGQALLSTGFCGALSTWSTFSNEVHSMASARRIAGAAGYVFVTVALGLGLSFAGMAVAQALW